LTEIAFLIFGKRSMILKTVNYFLNLNFLFLHAHLWESSTARHWSLLATRICHPSPRILGFGCQILMTQIPVKFVGIRPVGARIWQFAPDSDDLDSGKTSWNLASTARIWLYCAGLRQNWPESGHFCRMPTIVLGIRH